MKVLIFEKEHFEGAFPVIRLFDQPGTEIVVATSADTHRRFLDLLGSAANRYRWIILPTSGKWAFFRSLYYHLRRERPDLLYVNTISDNHLLYAWAIRMGRLPRTLMTVQIRSEAQLEEAEVPPEMENVQYHHADYDEALATANPERNVAQPEVNLAPKVGRNDPCPCGSGKKYKHCHGKLN